MSCVAELAKRRKSVRKFKPDNFDMEVIIECIDVAKEAPSGSNAQPWHFVIVKDEELKRKVREVCERGKRNSTLT